MEAIPKTKPIRSKRLTRGAEGQSCVRCGVRDGTVVAAHYQGFRSYALGKSKGCKPHDLAVADLCHQCHALFDSYDDSLIADPCMRKIDHSERFLFYILLTLVRRMQQDVLHD